MELHALDPGWTAATINLNGNGGLDEIRVAATPAVATTNVDTGAGVPDRTVIGAVVGSSGTDATNFAQFNTGVSTLDFIVGPVNVDDGGEKRYVVWLSNPVLLAIGGVAIVVLVMLVAMASRGGTTVIKE